MTAGSVGWWLCFAAAYLVAGTLFAWAEWSDTVRMALQAASSPRQFKRFVFVWCLVSVLLWPLGLLVNLISVTLGPKP